MFCNGYTCLINHIRTDKLFPLNIVTWIVLNTPVESIFVPLAVAKTPRSYINANLNKYDTKSA